MEVDHQNFAEYVTATVGGQLFGLPILRVQDVFKPERLTRVPLSPPEISGVLNLRGRIVTIVDLRVRLGLGNCEDGAARMAVGVETAGESYGLLVDAVGEVLKLDSRQLEAAPVNLDPRLSALSAGIHRLDDKLLLVLDLDKVLDLRAAAAAA